MEGAVTQSPVRAMTPMRVQPDYRTLRVNQRMSIQDQLNVSDLKNRWGIEGYKMPFNTGLLQRRPDYSFPKDKSRSFLESLQKTASKLPAPGSYSCKLKWVKGTSDLLKKGSKRKTIFDQVSQQASKVPAPNAYFKSKKNKGPGISPLPRQDRLNFLSEAQFLGKYNPGPGDYKPNVRYTPSTGWKSTPKFRYTKPKEQKGEWKPKKNTIPGPSSYTPKSVSLKKAPSALILKSKDVKFTEKEIKLHQSVPGVGKYSPEKAFKRISTPAPRTYRL